MRKSDLIIESLNRLNEAGVHDFKGTNPKDEFNRVVDRHRLGKLSILSRNYQTPLNINRAKFLCDDFDYLLKRLYEVVRYIKLSYYDFRQEYYIQHCTDKRAFSDAKKLWKKEKIHTSLPFAYVHLTFCIRNEYFESNKFDVDDIVEILTSRDYCNPILQKEYIQVVNSIPIDKGSIKPVLYVCRTNSGEGKFFNLRAVFDYFPEDIDI